MKMKWMLAAGLALASVQAQAAPIPGQGVIALVGGVVNTGAQALAPLTSPLLGALNGPGSSSIMQTYGNIPFQLLGGLATKPVQTLIRPPLPGLK